MHLELWLCGYLWGWGLGSPIRKRDIGFEKIIILSPSLFRNKDKIVFFPSKMVSALLPLCMTWYHALGYCILNALDMIFNYYCKKHESRGDPFIHDPLIQSQDTLAVS
jgi:hypothetical protein